MRIQVFDGIQSLPEAHRMVLSNGTEAGFFCTPTWYENLEQTVLGTTQEVFYYSVEDRESVLLVVPMRRFATKRAPGLKKFGGFRNFTGFKGTKGLKSFTNFYSPVFTPAVGGIDEQQVQLALEALCRYWVREGWDVVDLEPLASESGIYVRLQDALSKAGLSAFSYYRFGNWYLDAQGLNSDQYLALLPKKLRHTIRRAPEKIEEHYRLQTLIYSNDSQVSDERLAATFLEVYEDSWHTPEPYPDFLPGLIRMAARQGCLRLGVLYFDDEPAAAQLWFVHNSVASIFKVAYKERFSEYSPGSLLTMAMLRHVLDEDSVAEVDFLSGDDDYKRNWMSHRRERWGLRAYNRRTLRGALMTLIEFAKAGYKKIREQQPPAPDCQSRLKSRAPENGSAAS